MGQMWLTLPIYTSLSSKRFVPGNISQSRSFLLVLYEVSSKTVFSFHKLHGAAFVILVVLQISFSLCSQRLILVCFVRVIKVSGKMINC